MQRRYEIVCRTCGQIESDTTSDGLFDEATANRRAGHHEGVYDGLDDNRDHNCEVQAVEETNEYRCPVCHTKCVGEDERDKHARTEPGVQPSSFVRV
jgi:hypothetical protein